MDIKKSLISFFVDDKTSFFHLILQGLLCLLVTWFVFKKKESKRKFTLTKEEEEAIIEGWTPFPLVCVDEELIDEKTRIVESKCGLFVKINGRDCFNLASFSFLGLSEHREIEEKVIETIKRYGVGSCGPRGFYGTVDVHLDLESKLAKFMGVEEAVVYSYGFSTMASAIPAYAKRGDIIFVDEHVNFAIQKGLDASRSVIKFFNHNDMEHLERLLIEQQNLDVKNKKKAASTRKFLVVEGIYLKTGQICPLPKLIELRKTYKLRIFIDESVSFGTLGTNGRGVTEYFDVPMREVDLIMASMEFALSSVGGFCLGSTFIVEHQRLSGLGYCFSASLPPLLTSAATKALDIIENNPQLINKLNEVSSDFHDALLDNEVIMSYFRLEGDRISPIKHLVPKLGGSTFVDLIVEKCELNNLAVTAAAYLRTEKNPVNPSIRLSINRLLEDHITNIVQLLEKSVMQAVI